MGGEEGLDDGGEGVVRAMQQDVALPTDTPGHIYNQFVIRVADRAQPLDGPARGHELDRVGDGDDIRKRFGFSTA